MSQATTVTEAPLAPRRRITFRKMALVFVVLLAIGFTLAVVVYRKYVAYEPTAAQHVPQGASFSARFDLTHVMLYEPFRRAGFPLVERGVTTGSPRRDRLAARGLVVGADVREVVVALGPAPGDWVIGVGGRLPKSGAAATVAEILREEGRTVAQSGQGYVVIPAGITFGQATDGTLLIASNAERLGAALAGSAPHPELSLGAGGLVLEPSGLIPGLRHVKAHWRAGSVVAVDARAQFDASGGPIHALVPALLSGVAAVDPSLEAPMKAAVVTSTSDSTAIRVELPKETVQRLIALAVERFPF